MSFSWKGKRCLVTGVEGFVASHIARRLAESGASVVGIDHARKTFSNLEAFGIIDKVDVEHGDIADIDFVQEVFNAYKIDACFHIAAAAIVSDAVKSPIAAFRSNIAGTWNVLECARLSASTKSIVVASSDKAYGEHSKLPYRENYALRGVHIYDASKACADLLSQAYFFNYRLPVIVTRCSNIYGPGDRNFSRIIPRSIMRVRLGLKPIVYKGSEEYVREYLYVEDAADAYLRLAEHAYAKKLGYPVNGEEAYSYCAYNIGGGEKNRVETLVLIKKILKLMNKKETEYEIREKEDKAFLEIPRQYLSNDKIYKELDFLPKISIEEGLSRTVKWYEDNFTDEEAAKLVTDAQFVGAGK